MPTSSPSPVQVTLLTKPGCHLCDDARAVIADVIAAVAEQGVAVELQETNILADPQLARLHAEDIPVVIINGKRHAIWHVDREKFTAALHKAATRARRRFLVGPVRPAAPATQTPPTSTQGAS